jgi:hypothetical protein
MRQPPRLWVTILITIVLGLLTALAGILGNIAASTTPQATPYLRLAWPALGVVVLLGIGVSVWQVRREAKAAALPEQSQQQVPLPTAPAAEVQPVSSPATSPTSSASQLASGTYHSCVLSYATADQPFAEQLHANLQQAGVSCWFAPHDLKTGGKLRTQIYDAIQRQDKLLLILSEQAMQSDWVEREVEVAFEREQQPPKTLALFPIRLDDAVMQTQAAWAGDIRRMRFIGDFRQWQDGTAYQRALQRLLRDLQA